MESETNSEQAGNESRTRQAFYTLLILVGVGLAAVLAYTALSCDCPNKCGGLSIGVLTATAALAVGGFFGFLFGMPRSTGDKVVVEHTTTQPGATKPATPNINSTKTKPNTNLEEISDWLTKILVGAGLTQLNKIGSKLADLSSYVAKGMCGTDADKSFVAIAIVFFGVCGFLAAFLWTRLYMGKAIQAADSSVQEVKQALQETSQQLKETDQRQQAEIEKAKELVKKLALTGAEQAMEDPLLSETGQLRAEKSQIEVAANLVAGEDQATLDSKDLQILAYSSFEKGDYTAVVQYAEKAIAISAPKQDLWKIYNLMGLAYHWQEPHDWKPGADMSWFKRSVESYEKAVANRNTLAEELLSKANCAFVYLDAEKYQECERIASEVLSNEKVGGMVIVQICDLARIAIAASAAMRGDTATAVSALNDTRNINQFEYLFNIDDLPVEAIKAFAKLNGLKDSVAAFVVRMATGLKLT